MFRVHRLLPLLIVSLCASAFSQRQGSPSARTLDSLLNKGYAALHTGPSEALPFFQEAVRLDSTNLTAVRQLGFIYINLQRPEDALQCFRRVQRLAPSDTVQMQIAYLLSGLGRNAEACDMFSGLVESSDPRIRADSRAASTVLSLMLCERAEPWWGKVYAAPYYDTRFHDFIFSLAGYAGRYMGDGRVLSLYGTASMSRDTRSAGGAVPVIYSDNYILFGGGIRVNPLAGLTADIQGGGSVDLVRRPGHATTNGDFRAVASYGAGLYPGIVTPDDWQWSFSPLAEGYASIGYYSRYTNTIGYGTGRLGVRLGEYRRSLLDAYLVVNLVADAENVFYNNIIEMGAGLRIIPDLRWGLALLAEYHRGAYWRASGSVNPYGRSYDSFRVFLVFDRWICW